MIAYQYVSATQSFNVFSFTATLKGSQVLFLEVFISYYGNVILKF